jgi:hypothetical protein
MHALYFLGYAVMATVAGMVIAQAQYSRMKTEGTPMSFGFLKAAAGIALFMWTAAGVTSIAYSLAA